MEELYLPARLRLRTTRFRQAGGAAIAFSPRGNLLAMDDETGALTLTAFPSGLVNYRLPGHPRGVFDVTFTPEGKRLISAGHNATIRICDTASGKQVQVVYPAQEERGAWCLAVSPDGKVLAMSHPDTSILLWDVPGR